MSKGRTEDAAIVGRRGRRDFDLIGRPLEKKQRNEPSSYSLDRASQLTWLEERCCWLEGREISS